MSAFLERYPSAIATIDKRAQTDDIAAWCTNARLRAAIDFSLTNDGHELLGFHDGPRNMWAATDTLPLLEILKQQGILRFRRDGVRPPGLIRRLMGFLLSELY